MFSMPPLADSPVSVFLLSRRQQMLRFLNADVAVSPQAKASSLQCGKVITPELRESTPFLKS